MLLRVKNLGPVREAELDLGKPLIVLTGPNNSGKTYLAWAAYSLSRLNGDLVEPPPVLDAWIDKLFQSESQSLDVTTLLDVHEDTLQAVAKALQGKLPEDFAASRTRFDETTIEISSVDLRALLARTSQLMMPYGGLWLGLAFYDKRVRVRVGVRNPDTDRDEDVPLSVLQSERLSIAKTGTARLAVHAIMASLLDRRYIVLPVERLAINLFARELAAERTELVDELLIDAADSLAPTTLREKLQSRAGRYPLVIRDALQKAVRLSGKGRTGPLADLADELETDVLGGNVELDAEDNLRFIPHQDPDKKPLGLHESASVVKSLVSLVLYLRHDAHPGQSQVIDEPELNLHPDNQRRVARILAKAVNRGLKIMMSTHSDYVIRELNNLVMLGQDSDEARKLVLDLGYQPKQTLRPDQIGAYLVNDGACTSLDVTETGFETKTIEDEIHKLNQDAQTIYFRLFGD